MTAPLAPFKFVVHFAKAKAGLPIRGGLARAAAGWSYLFKNYVLKDWVTFAEVYGQPLRVGKYGAGATEARQASVTQGSRQYRHRRRSDHSRLDASSSSSKRARPAASDLYERFCEYLDRQVSKAVLGQTLTTEMPRRRRLARGRAGP